MYYIPQFRNISSKLLSRVRTLNSYHGSTRGYSRNVQKQQMLQNHLSTFIHSGYASSDFNNIQFEYTNGMSPFTFENAENRMSDTGLGCDFTDIFGPGLDIAFRFCSAGLDMLNEWEKVALERLLDFLDDIDIHQKRIQDILYTHHLLDIPYKEEEITLCYAEHLFKHLIPGGKYTVSQATRRTRDGCCSCGIPGSYGFTGFGHHTVWHGHPDMIIKGNDWGNTVLTFRSSKAIQEKSTKFDLEGTVWEGTFINNTDDSFALAEIDMAEAETAKEINLSVSQTVTFSFLQRNKAKKRQTLVPGIMLDSKGFVVYLYDCMQDILLMSINTPDLFEITYEDDRPVISNLNTMAVIYLWFVLNHGKFCSGLTPIVSSSLVESGFHGLVGRRIHVYKQLLDDNVSHFPDIPKSSRNFMPFSHREARRKKKEDVPTDKDSK